MSSILAGLNDAQRSAVSSPAAVLQVLAPPGSGKTKTLTARVAYLINHERYQPWDIIVCTFTIKAAREMKERIRGFVGEQLERKLILGTFHSVARRYLVSYGHYIGVSRDFGIVDSSDTMAILKRIIKRNRFTAEPSKAKSRISRIKARSTSLSKQEPTEKHEFDIIFAEYEETLKSSSMLDYDDLLLRCVDLLRECPNCVSNVQSVLVDEFQDTNNVQYELMSLFAQRHKRITVVGDPDQSIYSFRSAEIRNVERMRRHYLDTQVVLLEENYRSAGSILQSALELIEQDTTRPTKKLLPTHAVGEQPVLRLLPHPKAEASWIVSEIERSRLLSGGLLTHTDFAVLIRSGSQSQAIELSLGEAGVPYRMVGGHRFFDRWEVKVLLNYLRLINLPTHNDAVINVINLPPRGIGDTVVKELVAEAERKRIAIWQLVLDAVQDRAKIETRLKPQTRKGLESLVSLILKGQKKLAATERHSAVSDLLAFLIQRLSWKSFMRKKYPEEFESRWENVEELQLQAAQFRSGITIDDVESDEMLPVIDGLIQHDTQGAEAMLTHFLANVALATHAKVVEGEQLGGQVTISTIHAAKGLEWPVVFIASVYEGSIPHSRAEDHDEERRLLYVAMTRAQALLYMSSPVRMAVGSGASTLMISPFLSPPAVANLLNSKGPSFSHSTVQDLSHILRRPCPRISCLLTARKKIVQSEDDYWPQNGDDIRTYDCGRPVYDSQLEHLDKRRRVDVETSGFTAQRMTSSKFAGNVVSASVSTGTKQIASIGFVSASARMAELVEAKRVATRPFHSSARNVGTGPSKNGRADNRRSSITTDIKAFFVKPSLSLNDISLVNNQQLASSREDSMQDQRSQSLVREAFDRKMTVDRKGSTAFELSSPSPTSIATFSATYNENDYAESPQVETLPLANSAQRAILSRVGDNLDRLKNRNQGEMNSTIPHLKPALCFHTTSVAAAQQQPDGQRKCTLGIRRSLQGWTGTKAQNAFVTPLHSQTRR